MNTNEVEFMNIKIHVYVNILREKFKMVHLYTRIHITHAHKDSYDNVIKVQLVLYR